MEMYRQARLSTPDTHTSCCAAVQASILKADFVMEEVARLRGLLDNQSAGAAQGSAVAMATARAQNALAVLEAGAQDTRAELRSYAGYVALRSRALNKDAAAAAADAADPDVLGLPALEEEGQECEWLAGACPRGQHACYDPSLAGCMRAGSAGAMAQ
jgi:hypothetical protein